MPFPSLFLPPPLPISSSSARHLTCRHTKVHRKPVSHRLSPRASTSTPPPPATPSSKSEPLDLSTNTSTTPSTTAEAEKDSSESSSAVPGSESARQLLGIRGGSTGTAKWKIRLQLLKPVTWAPLLVGVTCGAAASGNYHWNNPEDIGKGVLCMLLAGPILTGFTQTMNDWYDRDIDRINEPSRPIPSGLISEGEVKTQILALMFAGFGVSAILDKWADHDWPVNMALTLFGVFMAYIYSAPPLKLKQNGWTGSFALGMSYIALPWWAGQALFGNLDWKTMVLTVFYSLAGLGIAIVNDFKSVEGDRATGMQSLPVMFGVEKAKWLCVGMIDGFQLATAAVLYGIGEHSYAYGIAALVLPQMLLQQKYFLKDPVKYDVKYQASAQPFLVLGIFVAALGIGHHGPL